MAKKTQAQIEFIAITKGYQDGIKQLNMSNKTLQNELKLNSTELKGNADDSTLLQKRQSLLQQESQNTAQKIKLLEDSLSEAEKTLGKNSKEYYTLNNSLISAKNQQAAIQNEIKQTTAKMEDQKKKTSNLDESIDDLGDSLNDTEKDVSVFGDVLKATLASDAIKEGFSQLTDLVITNGNDMERATNQLSASLGATDEPLESFREAMDQIYRDNYGENFDDIAESIREVSSQLGDMENDELISVTESAIGLRDTFDFDVKESIRAVKMMMDQFGLTSDQAFNLIAQGAQNGLDKNGDLLDTINEYSVHFNQIGMDADDMFNVLLKGTNAGTFSVDKLGDAVKEFSIRIKDGTADEALKKLGLNVDDVKKRFAQGGEVGKKAYQEINQALFSVKDTNEQFSLGVTMYGTMFEDLGADGVQSLSNLNGIMDMNIDSMNQIKEVKYDDVLAQLEGLKRGFEQDISGTLSTFVFPALSQLLTWVGDNKDLIGALVLGIGAGATAFGTITLAIGIYNGIMDIMALSTGAATVATTGLGTAFTFVTGPIGMITLAIGAAVAAGVALYKNWDTVCSWANKVKTTVANAWNGIKTAIVDKITGAKNVVSNVINAIKGFFSFKFSWPKLPLPHFSVKPKGWGIGDLLKGKIPSLGISWYAKGGFFKGPTVLSGLGEAGNEYALPLNDRTMTPLASLLAEKLNGIGSSVAQDLYADIYINVGDGMLVENVSKKVAIKVRREKRS